MQKGSDVRGHSHGIRVGILLSQESARTRVLRLTEDTYKPGSHFAQCFFTLNRSNVCTHHMVFKAVLSLSLLQGLVGAC